MKNKKLITLGFASVTVALALLFSTNLFAATAKKEQTKEASRLEALAKFTKVLSIVEQYNVDNVTIEELMDKDFECMMSNLDAHSNYLSQKDYKDLKVQTNGEFGGLGITVGVKDGALTVIAPIEGTPADKAGIKAGDIILKINEKSTLNMTIDEAVSIMRGKVGTKIELTIVREGETKPLAISITRAIITIESVYAKTIGDNIQYIRVTSFDKKVVSEVVTKYFPDFRRCLNELQKYSSNGSIDSGILINLGEESFNSLVLTLKNKKWLDMRKWLSNNVDMDSTQFYRMFYDNIVEKLNTKSIPEMIHLLGQYQFYSSQVADQEINNAAFLTEVMTANIEWK